MFGRGKDKKQGLSERRRYQAPVNESFDMAAYRRGTTLNSFKSDEPSKTERQKLKRLRSLRRRLAAVLAFVIVILILGLALLSQFTGNITGATAGKGVALTDADVQKYVKLVNDYFAKNSFERFSFARRGSVLSQYVESQAPEVASVKLGLSGLMSGKVELTMRQPVAMWVRGTDTSFVDAKGVVFTRNYYSMPNIVIEDASGVNVGGGVATSAKFLSFVGKTVVEIEMNPGLKVARVVIPHGSARYVEFYLDGRNYPFKAQITRDAYAQAHDIAVMTRYIDSRGLQPQYVDCRVEGKAYWK